MTQRYLYRLRLLEEWQTLLLCFACGGVAALAFAPWRYWFLLPVVLPLFYLMLEAAPGRRHALFRGFFFGYGYFMAGTWWIANALAVDIEKFGWLIPISIGGLSAVMALWFAVLGLLFWWRRAAHGLANLLRFLVLWVVVEYLRMLGMFGFPWNLLGYSAQASDAVSQLASLTGVFGLSLLVLAVALVPVPWIKQRINLAQRRAYTLVALLAFATVALFGAGRLPDQAVLTATRVRVVQPNIPQDMKWTQAGRLESLRIHAQLSQSPSADGVIPATILWSETALPFTIYPDSVWPSRLGSLLPPGSRLITGAVRADDSGKQLKLWNSIIGIDATGQLLGYYDKRQLVPFGEFVPLRAVLPLDKITPGSVDFSRGTVLEPLQFGDVPSFGALVCYEVIFPHISAHPAHRPDWLFNATNDAWYGDSPGPYEHFSISRMRAVEQGLPLVRAANTGISGVIDPYGRPVATLQLNQRGVLDRALPAPLKATPYARWREIPLMFVLLGLWLVSEWLARGNKRLT